ncbi:MAG: AAA family ATPase [Chloroflexi bacterium]|nr:AAA family ATPase [Chloroflexota bacterium]MBK6712159.1 AAA family ATPase [Chloroflexota bacterium]MBK7178648.1 AAA family ATPase [Chloroflexota bacterium]MBK7920133.1 AAA family ATPase [Chloroflexota bacterium]MBK8932132.1 AAA family ATPase [Chloroflexota bacterium]
MLTYVVGHPIKRPEDFYGRTEQVARFFEIVGGIQTQSLSVLGVRRAGKTSFFQYVSHPEVMARYVPNPRDYVMVYIDMSSCRTPADFYHRLINKLNHSLSGTRPLNLWQSPSGEANLYDVESILCQHPHRRIILLLDEFDHIRTGSFTEDFLTELRAMTGVFDYELACITSSYWKLSQLGEQIGLPPTSPFYNIFYPTPLYLPGLELREVELLIRQPAMQTGLLYVDNEVADIHALAGSLPFFVQAAAAKWYETKLYGMPPTFNALLPQLLVSLAPYMAQWWRDLTKCERDYLRSLALRTAVQPDWAHSPALNAARRKLRALGFIVPGLNDWNVNGAIFAEWIRQNAASTEQDETETAVSLPTTTIINPTDIRRLLNDYFDYQELRTLCFDLGLDYDYLSGEGKGAKIRELVGFIQRRDQNLDRLVSAIRIERGQII